MIMYIPWILIIMVIGALLGNFVAFCTMKRIGRDICLIDTKRCLRCDAVDYCPIVKGREERMKILEG